MGQPDRCNRPRCRGAGTMNIQAYGIQLCEKHWEEYADFVFLPCRNANDYMISGEIELSFLAECGSEPAKELLELWAKDTKRFLSTWKTSGMHIEPWKAWRIADLPPKIVSLCKTRFGIQNPMGEETKEVELPAIMDIDDFKIDLDNLPDDIDF